MVIRGFEKNTESKEAESLFICHTPYLTTKLFTEIINQDAAVTQGFLKFCNNYCTISAEMILKSW